MNSKEALRHLDATITDTQAKLTQAITHEATAKAEHSAANDHLKLLRRELRQAKAEFSAGDGVDLKQFEQPSIDAFQRHKIADEALETATATTDLIRQRLSIAKAARSKYVATDLPSVYRDEFDRMSAEVMQTLARVTVCYATYNKLASGTIEVDKLVRIIARGNPLNLTGAADQLRADFGA